MFYCCPGGGRSAPVMAVTSATLGAAEVQALVGRPRAFVAKGAERRGLVLERWD